MRSFFAGRRAIAANPVVEAVEAFEAEGRTGRGALGEFWEERGSAWSTSVLAELVKVDLRNRYDAGQNPRAAEYLDRFPELTDLRDRVVSLVYEEFCLRQEKGEDPDSEAFCDGYDAWRDSLRSQLVYHRELSRIVGADTPRIKFPGVGERFAQYRLMSILGTGGAARVYLATEDDLGGRKVALKVSASVGREPSILANLDHRNIVPILTVAESEEGLRGFCMPYRPGVTLEALIKRIGRGDPPSRARAIWEALEPVDRDQEERGDEDRAGWSGFPVSGSFTEAVAWIGLAMANALTYLHGRGILHRDIKPANVLLSYREGPQLLDFNLAHAPSTADHAQAALRGGTLPYMAPEQLRAFVDKAKWDDVGPAADVYALGLVLRELVTGKEPAMPGPGLSLPRTIQALLDLRSEPPIPIRQINPAIPPALASIIATCLNFEKSDRYAQAAELAEDLKRFLEYRPLKFARNTSSIERGANCLRRNRQLAVGVVLIMGVTVAVGQAALNVPGDPVPIKDRPDFRQAVRDLDSHNLTLWRKASEAFELFREREPNSAWPLLYQGLAHEKLENRHAANLAFNQFLDKRPDAEAAADWRIKEDRRAISARLLKGVLCNRKSRFEDAFQVLSVADRLSPDKVNILMSLASAERDTSRESEAMDHFARALELGEKDQSVSLKDILICREALLSLFTKQALSLLNGGTVDQRKQASPILARLEENLRSYEKERRLQEVAKGLRDDLYHNYYGGQVASGRAVLAADRGDLEGAKREIDRARTLLDAAVRASPDPTAIGVKIRLGAVQARDLVEERFGRFVRPLIEAAGAAPEPR